MAQSFDEALDAETVLWAVRGMNASRLGVSAEDVARFLSKDTTLSTRYDRDDVGVVLDSLTADGMLTYEPTTGEWAAIDANGNVAGAEETQDTVIDLREPDAGGDHLDDAFTGVFAELRPVEDAKPPASLGGAVAEAFLRLRIDVVERERNEAAEERDDWRRRAESFEKDVAAARAVSDDLRARVRELEDLLDRERAAGHERWDTTRRAAQALARAQEELERLEPMPVEEETDRQHTRSRRALRGNWLSS
jgi:hypothetical protein